MLLVLDSGIGGLTVAAAIRRVLPGVGMTYLADHGGYPYGALTDAALTERLLRVLDAAIAQVNPSAVVVACNTASTVALAAMRARFALPFIGCVPPIKPAAQLSRSRCIGLLATPATVRRAYIEDLVARFAADCRVISHGALRLADLAEARFRGEPVDQTALRDELDALLAQPGADAIDTIVLGCTHYALLLPDLRRLAPQITHWLDPAEPVARQVRAVLQASGALPTGPDGCALTTAPLPEMTLRGLAACGFAETRLLAMDTVYGT